MIISVRLKIPWPATAVPVQVRQRAPYSGAIPAGAPHEARPALFDTASTIGTVMAEIAMPTIHTSPSTMIATFTELSHKSHAVGSLGRTHGELAIAFAG